MAQLGKREREALAAIGERYPVNPHMQHSRGKRRLSAKARLHVNSGGDQFAWNLNPSRKPKATDAQVIDRSTREHDQRILQRAAATRWRGTDGFLYINGVKVEG